LNNLIIAPEISTSDTIKINIDKIIIIGVKIKYRTIFNVIIYMRYIITSHRISGNIPIEKTTKGIRKVARKNLTFDSDG